MNKIVIVGGGSAGWMTAATLIKAFPDKDITLIESPNTPTVGVGESTIGQIRQWTKFLEIDDKDFITHTDGSYKLSIKFTDFYEKESFFHYPFGRPNFQNNIADGNDWWFKKLLYKNTPNNDYADCIYPQMALVNSNKLDYEIQGLPFDFYNDTAFHFDSTKFGLWLKNNYCKPRGVKHIEEDIDLIEQDENGIKKLNNKYTADLFIDCTGFKSLLLGKELKEEFISYNDILPNNSAWATKIKYTNKRKQLQPYTNCTAYNNGWIWNIPLWSRIGTGYVYSDKFISDDDALKEFKKYLGTEELEFKKIKMRVGIHKRLWVKNVVAIGLSAGFIEPLESNGLFSVHEFLMNLVRELRREKVSQWDRDNFNYVCNLTFRNFAEFVALHYALSHRDDTEYWKNNLNKEWSKTLSEILPTMYIGFDAAVRNRAFNFHHDYKAGIHCIAAGMNWSSTDLPTLLKNNIKTDKKQWENTFKEVSYKLQEKKKYWKSLVKDTNTLYDFLKDNYYENSTTK